MPKSKLSNIELKDDYQQVVVCPGGLGNDSPSDFERWVKEVFNVDSQFLLVHDAGSPDSPSREILFAITLKNMSSFAIRRLAYGMRWFEDAYNNDPKRYTQEFKDKFYNWDEE